MEAARKVNDRLVTPPAELVDRLAQEEGVVAKEVYEFTAKLAGLTEEDAIILADELRYRRRWNVHTYLAVMECLDAARQVTN